MVAADLAEGLLSSWGLEAARDSQGQGARPGRRRLPPPLAGPGLPVILANYVTLEAGTGLVHTAPGHGQEDYDIGRHYGLATYSPVDDGGRFTEEVPEFAGRRSATPTPASSNCLRGQGMLLAAEKITHSYPHCWRCKQPIIFRATEQWFISMEANGLRAKGPGGNRPGHLDPPLGPGAHLRHGGAAPGLVHLPPAGLGRAHRGLPLPGVRRGAAHPGDPGRASSQRVRQEGADVWFDTPAAELLPPGTPAPAAPPTSRRRRTSWTSGSTPA